MATQSSPTINALLEYPSTDRRLVLENTIGNLLNSRPIKLADNVFTLESIIIVEHSQHKDHWGNLLDGREIRQADTISLLTSDGKCYLRHDQSENILLLDNVTCKVE
jgi:hypothetical protein